MTELLEKAFSEVAKLPASEQDALASWILSELAAEASWQQAFDDSQDTLVRLAEEALAENRRGETEILDPDAL